MADSGSDAPLCANNCGFYGNPKNQNLCSICFAASLEETGEDSRRGEIGTEEFVRIVETNLGTRRSPSTDQSRSETCESVAGLSNSAPKIKNRCKICKKKVGLLGFNCRCGDLFCGRHRYPEAHSCDVDHKSIGREILAKKIVECKADKLEFRV